METRQMNIVLAELGSNPFGQALRSGRLLATLKSKKTGAYVAMSFRCKAKVEGSKTAWKHSSFADADRIYIDTARSDDRTTPIACWHLTGKWRGLLMTPWGHDGFDPKRLWAAVKTIEVAAGRAPDEGEQYELMQGENCLICGRELTQDVSIERRIGAKCWEAVMASAPKESEAGHVPRSKAEHQEKTRVDRAVGEALRTEAVRRAPEGVQLTTLAPGTKASEVC